jgi:predicted DNA-binding transcriptional regulator YafY
LNASEFPPLGLSELQIASLHLARLQLAPLGGTLLLQELDRFLAATKPQDRQAPRHQTSFHFAESLKPAPAPRVVRTIEKALASRRRACIEYRAATRAGATTRVHIEPLVVSVAEADPYVRAFCIERNEERTYKLSRIQAAELTRDRATYRPARTAGSPFPGALKAWSGAPHAVEVRLDPSVAWLAREYPLLVPPRSRGGPIEATPRPSQSSRHASVPPRSRGGPIEANPAPAPTTHGPSRVSVTMDRVG